MSEFARLAGFENAEPRDIIPRTVPTEEDIWANFARMMSEAAKEIEGERDELRRILAPILDAEGLAGCAEDCCQLCGRSLGLVPRHEPHCLVLDRDRLLGRTP